MHDTIKRQEALLLAALVLTQPHRQLCNPTARIQLGHKMSLCVPAFGTAGLQTWLGWCCFCKQQCISSNALAAMHWQQRIGSSALGPMCDAPPVVCDMCVGTHNWLQLALLISCRRLQLLTQLHCIGLHAHKTRAVASAQLCTVTLQLSLKLPR